MKALFVVFNQALSEQVAQTIQRAGVRGFTRWTNVEGVGTHTGEPHLGTHTWPAINSATLIITSEEQASVLMARLHALNEQTPQQGLRVFAWSITETV